MEESPQETQTPPTPGDRAALVRELDTVIDEHLGRLRAEISDLTNLAERIFEDWRTLASSLELRTKFAAGSPHAAADEFANMNLPRDLFRWLHEVQESKHRPPSRRAGRPGGRIDEILQLLGAAGRPMTSDEIVAAMEEKNLLDGVNDPRATVSAALSRGTRLGFFERVSRGVYTAGQNVREG